jgi:ATP-dependent DNA helicase RecG
MASQTEILLKILKLESDRGYDNRAVFGGLEKMIRMWEKEARADQREESYIQNVIDMLTQYGTLPQEERAEHHRQLVDILQKSLPAPGEAPSRPQRSQRPPQRSFPPRRPVEAAIEPPPPPPLDDADLPPVSNHTIDNDNRQTNSPRRQQHPQSRLNDVNSTPGLGAPLTVLPGIGPKTAQTFKGLGIYTLGDMLYYFPRRYDDYSQLKPINRLTYGEEVTVIGTVHSVETRPTKGGRLQLTEMIVTDGTAFLRLNWFNSPWVEHRYTKGVQVVASGKVEQYLGRPIISHPEIEFIDQEHLHTNRIVPFYPLSGKLSQRILRREMNRLIQYWAPRIPDYIPDYIRSQAGLVDLSTAIRQAHFPDNQDLLKAARSRLAFDEIFLLQLGVMRQKQSWQSVTAQVFSVEEDWLQDQMNGLPYTLTNAQKRVLEDIRTDLASSKPMNRLVQGDVGSGKTIVAALAAAIVTRRGAQVAFMAPTSILAEQHYKSLVRLFTNQENAERNLFTPEQVRLLVGDTSEADKREIREKLASGEIKLIIGTHALIEDPITFNWLQLAIVDEQHRFGVEQRAALRQKGSNPHLLVMTATPIPRSLALTVYGDLDLSVLDELPAGRQPIETHVLPPRERERAYTLIRAQINQGRQAFVIYPLVEKGENDDVKAAVDEHELLQTKVFPQYKIGLLHGRMRPDEKEKVMSYFRAGEFHILVSTSVVEVGVDVPNATVMVIEGANRFGLAQLHQFRGRVGRGQEQSYCLLIPDNDDATENQRLAVMAETNDGFVLAERDLEQRGPGDFLGTRQAGFAELRMASLMDVHLIEKARQHAQAVFAQDPTLSSPEHQALERAVKRFWSDIRGDIS